MHAIMIFIDLWDRNLKPQNHGHKNPRACRIFIFDGVRWPLRARERLILQVPGPATEHERGSLVSSQLGGFAFVGD